MKKVSERDVCRFYAKRKRIKRFCYLIKWHGKSMLTLTFTNGNRVCRKSHHANATTAICIFRCLFFSHWKFLLPFTFAALKGRTQHEVIKNSMGMICSVFVGPQCFRVINPRQSFTLTIVSPLVM